MKPSNMLHEMCHVGLAGTDVKALCKARELPPEATSSRGILETLFLSPQGLTNAFESLDSKEIALLQLLKDSKVPADVEFFSRIYGGGHSYGTYSQRFQNCFAKVKQRLIRTGVLLFAEAPQGTWEKKSKMERWRFALPAEFREYLPSLLRSPRQFDGDGRGDQPPQTRNTAAGETTVRRGIPRRASRARQAETGIGQGRFPGRGFGRLPGRRGAGNRAPRADADR